MKFIKLVVPVSLILLLCSFYKLQNKPTNHPEIHWMTWEEMQIAQKKHPKKIFVDVYTDWCGWCKKMDKTTFEHPEIIALMNKDFYAIKFDAESKKPIIFNGKTYTNTGKYHELANEIMNQQAGFPTSVYLNEKFVAMTPPIASYLEPKQLEGILAYLGGDFHTKIPFEEFSKKFNSKIK